MMMKQGGATGWVCVLNERESSQLRGILILKSLINFSAF